MTKNKNLKDYNKLVVEFPYANLEFFNDSLKKTINYYLSKSGYNGDSIKILLGISYSTLTTLYENEDNRPLDFKLIYDLCIVLNVQMGEFVERLEGMF